MRRESILELLTTIRTAAGTGLLLCAELESAPKGLPIGAKLEELAGTLQLILEVTDDHETGIPTEARALHREPSTD